MTEFVTSNRQLVAYLFASNVMRLKRKDVNGDEVVWRWYDPENLGPGIAAGFEDGSLLVSARAYAKALGSTYWTWRRTLDQASIPLPPRKSMRSDEVRESSGSFNIPAAWLKS
jgi:hypothetical protein